MTLTDDTVLVFGHTSPETALVIDDYPYGRSLRCKIRYWIETHPKHPKHGARFCSQTTDPRLPGECWNKPKKSTYVQVAVMTRTPVTTSRGEVLGVSWAGIGLYPNTADLELFDRRCREHLDDDQRKVLELIVKLHRGLAWRDVVRTALAVAEQAGRDAYVAGASPSAPVDLWVDGPVGSDPQLAVKAWNAGWNKAADDAAWAAVRA